ncbi:MAG: ABC transporter ATP-binding protein [Opitutaceae bacterium]|nr:ABC transporter ATP-binding protein [Cytophagales bacterium]
MSDIAIKVENLSKMYRLGDIGTGSLGTDITQWWAKLRGKEDPIANTAIANDRSKKSESDFVWSLKNIDFEIKKGEALGIIGKNGAGKSTLLKILSRTTSPTTGSIKIKGKVASLLEVGTGFHGDLSGKENIYMNGAILGMTRREITTKLDEIIDFSGVAGYIDTPVKRYSSGMYVRLAFAVAAHLEPDILIVDEVLAVGDADFQKKCLGKMQDVNNGEGRTVIFVSHNMAAVNQLCNKALYLKNGTINSYGETNQIISKYLNSDDEDKKAFYDLELFKRRTGTGKARFLNVGLKKTNSSTFTREFSIGDNIQVTFSLKSLNSIARKLKTAIEIKNSDGLKICTAIDIDSVHQVFAEKVGEEIKYIVEFGDIRLYPDTYYICLYVGDMSSTESYDYLEDCISFEIIDGGNYTKRLLPKSGGVLFFTPEWKQLDR